MDNFLNKITHLARRDALDFTQKLALQQAIREVRDLRRLRRDQPRVARADRGVKKRAQLAPKQVISECKVCHLPWPHVTKWARSRHGYAMVRRRGTKARKRLLAAGQPWGEKFREMGRAAKARNYTAARVAIFKEVAPHAFDVLGQRAVEEIINHRKHQLVRDRRSHFRYWAATQHGGRGRKIP
jgi:hypothetical protein